MESLLFRMVLFRVLTLKVVLYYCFLKMIMLFSSRNIKLLVVFEMFEINNTLSLVGHNEFKDVRMVLICYPRLSSSPVA